MPHKEMVCSVGDSGHEVKQVMGIVRKIQMKKTMAFSDLPPSAMSLLGEVEVVTVVASVR